MSRPPTAPPEAPRSSAPAESPAAAAAPAATVAPPAAAGSSVPVPSHLSQLKTHHVTELVDMAVAHGIENASRLRKQDLIFALLKSQAKKGVSIFGDGTLEVLPDGFGFLRSPDTSYLASTD